MSDVSSKWYDMVQRICNSRNDALALKEEFVNMAFKSSQLTLQKKKDGLLSQNDGCWDAVNHHLRTLSITEILEGSHIGTGRDRFYLEATFEADIIPRRI